MPGDRLAELFVHHVLADSLTQGQLPADEVAPVRCSFEPESSLERRAVEGLAHVLAQHDAQHLSVVLGVVVQNEAINGRSRMTGINTLTRGAGLRELSR